MQNRVTEGRTPDIVGVWFVADQSGSLADPANRTSLTVRRVAAEKGPYSDGFFLFQWDGDPGLSKGYYTLKTGRIVFNTTRVVGGRRLSVQYRGNLRRSGGRTQIVGQAGPIGLSELRDGAVRDWPFTATRQAERRR